MIEDSQIPENELNKPAPQEEITRVPQTIARKSKIMAAATMGFLMLTLVTAYQFSSKNYPSLKESQAADEIYTEYAGAVIPTKSPKYIEDLMLYKSLVDTTPQIINNFELRHDDTTDTISVVLHPPFETSRTNFFTWIQGTKYGVLPGDYFTFVVNDAPLPTPTPKPTSTPTPAPTSTPRPTSTPIPPTPTPVPKPVVSWVFIYGTNLVIKGPSLGVTGSTYPVSVVYGTTTKNFSTIVKSEPPNQTIYIALSSLPSFSIKTLSKITINNNPIYFPKTIFIYGTNLVIGSTVLGTPGKASLVTITWGSQIFQKYMNIVQEDIQKTYIPLSSLPGFSLTNTYQVMVAP